MKNLRNLRKQKAAEQAVKVIFHNYMEDLGALQQFETANISSFTVELKGKARVPLAHVSVSSLPVSGMFQYRKR